MATYTENLNLKKPATGDQVLIGDINGNMDILDSAVTKSEILIVDFGTVSSLPVSQNVTGAETDMVCIHAELGTPSAQQSDWTVNTNTAGSITVSGTISGSTTLKLYMMKSR